MRRCRKKIVRMEKQRSRKKKSGAQGNKLIYSKTLQKWGSKKRAAGKIRVWSIVDRFLKSTGQIIGSLFLRSNITKLCPGLA